MPELHAFSFEGETVAGAALDCAIILPLDGAVDLGSARAGARHGVAVVLLETGIGLDEAGVLHVTSVWFFG